MFTHRAIVPLVVIGEPESTSNPSEPDIATLVTVQDPPVTATSGSHGVPAPVMVVPSTESCTIGLAGSVLSVFNHVTESTHPPPPHPV